MSFSTFSRNRDQRQHEARKRRKVARRLNRVCKFDPRHPERRVKPQSRFLHLWSEV